MVTVVQCVQKKRDQSVLCSTCDKTGVILIKFDTKFPE